MNLVDEIVSRMNEAYRCFPIENGVRMNTHCLYPGNGNVQIVVFGAGSSYFVTDDGGAIREAEAAGAEIKHPDMKFSKALAKQGLGMKNGAIISPAVGLDNIAAAITIVANASKEVSEALFDSWKLARARNIKDMVKNMLHQELQRETTEEKIPGKSNKPHSFENVIDFMNGSKLLVDAVIRDPSSINARFVANLDVRSKQYPQITQRIIYDDNDDWQAADLSLLSDTGVPVIGFSKSEAALREAMAHI